jgi:hypothetical protein
MLAHKVVQQSGLAVSPAPFNDQAWIVGRRAECSDLERRQTAIAGSPALGYCPVVVHPSRRIDIRHDVPRWLSRLTITTGEGFP